MNMHVENEKHFSSWKLIFFPISKLLGVPGALWTLNLLQVCTWSQGTWEIKVIWYEINCFTLLHLTLDDPIFIKCFCSNQILFHPWKEWSLDSNFSLASKPEGHNNWKFWQGQTWLVWILYYHIIIYHIILFYE